MYWADPAGGAVLVQAPGGDVGRVEVSLLEVHGITYDGRGGREVLWLADPGFKMRPPRYEPEGRAGAAGCFDLATREFRPLTPPDLPAYAGDSWRPTAVAVSGDTVVVADGYGASLVHYFRGSEYLLTLNGSDTGTDFQCPHDIAILDDQRLVVADRGNHRLVSFRLDGTYLGTFTDPLVRSPAGLAVRDGRLIVADVERAVLAVDLDGERVEEIVAYPGVPKQPGWPNLDRGGETVRPDLAVGVLNSPHSVAVGVDGSVYVTEFVIGGREIRLVPAGPGN